MAMTTSNHEGHRNRLCERIRTQGIGSLYDHEILEYLLYPFLPRRNTNDIAHNLLAVFGTLAGVLDAQYDALMRVEGVTDRMALFLSNVPAVFAQYNAEKHRRSGMFATPLAAAQYLCSHLGNMPYECFMALCLDAKGNLLQVVQMRSDAANSLQVNMRNLLRELVHSRAVNVVVGHNHPSGDASPSPHDYALLDALRRVLVDVGICLVDCIVVAGDAYTSMVACENSRRQAAAKPRPDAPAGVKMPATSSPRRMPMAASTSAPLSVANPPAADLSEEQPDLLNNPTPTED